jgi:hypothetical protein
MKHLLSLLFLLLLGAALSAQAPQVLNYQGVARSTNGSPLANESIKLRLSIQPANGNPFYVETHNVTTNQFGLYAVQIGQGAVVNGNFASIAWAQNTTFLQVEMDPAGGNNFTLVGTPTQLVSVPYSLEAQHAASTTLNGNVSGSSNANTVTAIQNRPVASAAPSTGDVLKWNGSQWQPGTDATSGGGSYSAGSGISISGNVISNNGDLDNYNELQSMYLIGNTLTLSDGGGSVTLPTGVNYNEGAGIEINGNTISNSGDLDNFNELQSISLSGNVLTLSDGGGSVTLPSGGGGGFSLPYTAMQSSSNSLMKLTNTGIGGAFHGISTGGGEPAIWGEDANGVYAGIQGSSTSGDGVIGSSGTGTGVWGQSTSGVGIYAESFNGTALEARSINGDYAIRAQGGAIGIEAKGVNGGIYGINEGPVGGFGVLGETLVSYGYGGSFRNNLGGVGLEVIGKFDLATPTGNGGYLDAYFAGVPGQSAVTLSGARFQPLYDNSYSLGISGSRWSTVYAANGTINTSDARQKQAIQPIGYGLQQVMAMKPVSFEWKSNPEQGRKLGFLAQDLQTIVPEVVADKEWVADEKGKQTAKPAEVLGVYYSDLIPVMAKAIQEQQAMMEALKIENGTLVKSVQDQQQMIEQQQKDIEAIKAVLKQK